MKWKISKSSRGEELYYESSLVQNLRDPQREGERFAKTFLSRRPPTTWNIFLGMGLGYHVRAFYELLKQAKVSPIRMICIFLDQEEEFLFKEHKTENFTFIEEEWIFLFLSETQKLQVILKEIIYSPWRAHLSIVEYFPIVRLFLPLYRNLTQKIQEWTAYEAQNLATTEYFSSIWAKNFLCNLPFFSPPSVRLHGDVILVSAGASLAQNLSFLAHQKGKVPIVVVDTALETLLTENIIPDIVVACDAQLDNYYDFFDLFFKKPFLKDEKIILLGNMTQYLKIPPLFEKHILFPTEGILESWTSILLGDSIPNIVSGGSVASFALSSLFYLGARRFILVGQDLENYPLKHVVSSPHHKRRIFSVTDRFHLFFDDLRPWLESPQIPARTPMLENLSYWIRDFFHFFPVKGLHKDPLRPIEGLPPYKGEILKGILELKEGKEDEDRFSQGRRNLIQKLLLSPETVGDWVGQRENLSLQEKTLLEVLFFKEERAGGYQKDREAYRQTVEKILTQIRVQTLREDL